MNYKPLTDTFPNQEIKMNMYLIACVFLSAALYTAEGCCTPDQWEGHIGGIGGLAHGHDDGAPELIVVKCTHNQKKM